jgi:predicted phage terminase large subunit-like protein
MVAATPALARVIRLHDGPQTIFGGSSADIAIYGGAAFSGKSVALILDPLRYVKRKGVECVMFRKTYPQIMAPGGLWSTSEMFYGDCGGIAKMGACEWEWPDGGLRVMFRHLQHEKNKFDWQGAAVPLMFFDELTHFTRGTFFYMLSRNRLSKDCGIKPYMRATCNPASDSWVADFLAWWIDPISGFPIPERSGVLRWFIQDEGDKLVWSDNPADLPQKPGRIPKSVTFVSAKITDNPTGLKMDPGYLSNLHALPLFERSQLLDGNWNVRPVAGMFFQRGWFEIIETAPADVIKTIRYWDRAATEATERTNPDWTVGLKMSKDRHGFYYVLDVVRFRGRPAEVQKQIKNIAIQDGYTTAIYLEEDPAQAGKADVDNLMKDLQGWEVRANRVAVDKVTRALASSAHSERGNIKLVRGRWNDTLLRELDGFCDLDALPLDLRPSETPKDDQVDAFSGAFNMLNR